MNRDEIEALCRASKVGRSWTPKEIDDAVCELLRKHGPDGHIDGHDWITELILQIVQHERVEATIRAKEKEAAEVVRILGEMGL